ncbi:MAG: branched-chain amino acid ABC transporter permease [Deltaproteobacteria bacterium]|nr:MAG: branched-chain amino acid ABC transporter permease [Deltaproteobacteria bacterium]
MASFILINVILGVSIHVTLSTGQLSLGNAGFMSIGAYTAALLSTKFGLPIPVGIAGGAILAGTTGGLVGIPSLRLSGVYLAIATLGFGEVIRAVAINWESLTGGAVGIAAIPQIGRVLLSKCRDMGLSPDALGLRPNQFISLSVFLILLLLTVLVVAFFLRLRRTRVGRAYEAIRLDERAAEAAGVPITYYKVLAFSQGALVSGLAGGLFAHTTSFVSPADFTYHRAVEILVFAVFGGSGHLLGPVFGATFLTLLPEALRAIAHYRYILYGLLLVLMMTYRPQGVVDAPLLRRFRRRAA